MTMGTTQDEVIAFLSDPANHGGATVERVATHCSIVFLAGPRAYKLKRAVRLPYLDYSSLSARRTFAEAEVALNRRTAPSLYDGVQAIVRTVDGRLAWDGPGEAVEYLVAMRRFPADALFDAMARTGTLDVALTAEAARAIARFHDDATIEPGHGGSAAIDWLLGNNQAAFAPSMPAIFPAADVVALGGAQRTALDRHRGLLDARRVRGMVRRCHGDLHLRNIVMLDGRPVPFDGIEFDDRLACIDVMYDLAFLLMDLLHRGMAAHANATLNAYLEAHGADDGLALLPLFLSLRATVRAHVGATAAMLSNEAGQAREARAYLAEARAHLVPAPARLIAIGGPSGTGKSRLAQALACHIGAAPGAVILRSDVIRKRLAGVPPTARLREGAYTAEATAAVYAALAAEAQTALLAGHAVIADAVFGRREERAALEVTARLAGVTLAGLWLDAPLAVRESRVATRMNDASDADIGIVRRQDDLGLSAPEWTAIDASGPPEATHRRAMSALALG